MSEFQKLNWWLVIPALAFLAYTLFVFFTILVPSGEVMQNNVATSVIVAATAACLYFFGLGAPRLRVVLWILCGLCMVASGILAF